MHRRNCDYKTIIDFYLNNKDTKMLETISNELKKSTNITKGEEIIMSSILQICESEETMKIFEWFFQQHPEEINESDQILSFMNHFNAIHIPSFSQY